VERRSDWGGSDAAELFEFRDTLPKTSTGKVDRQTLSQPS
jgi:acyl-CoA synthetase (AMP-forming)/AMP-acid ligase II